MTKRGLHQEKDASREYPQLYLGHETALLFWRAVHEGRLPHPEPLDARTVSPACITTYRELSHVDLAPLGIVMTTSGAIAAYEERLIDWGSARGEPLRRGLVPEGIALPPGIPAPLHVLAADPRQRRTRGGMRTHLAEGMLPAGSLCWVSDSIVVTSPELTLLQACTASRDLPNIELALELSGTYALHPASLPCRFETTPIMTRKSIAQFAENAAGRRGVNALRRTVAWLCDGLASPREAELYLLLVLPPEAGGYGLPLPVVNGVVKDRQTACEEGRMTEEEYAALVADLARLEPYVPDFLWKCGGRIVILEYDGFEEHEVDAVQVARDKERRSEFAARGCAVIVVTKRDMKSLQTFEAKVSQLMRALGLVPNAGGGEHASARQALFRWLANPQHDHLPFGYGYR